MLSVSDILKILEQNINSDAKACPSCNSFAYKLIKSEPDPNNG